MKEAERNQRKRKTTANTRNKDPKRKRQISRYRGE
jgi:hypothetical protein